MLQDEIDKYNCEECRKMQIFLHRNCTGGIIPEVQFRDNTVRFVIKDYGILNYCPKLLSYDPEVLELLELYSFYKDGFLLKEGSLENQPYKYLQFMKSLKTAESILEQRQYEELKDG